jgi:hypothetical protein
MYLYYAVLRRERNNLETNEIRSFWGVGGSRNSSHTAGMGTYEINNYLQRSMPVITLSLCLISYAWESGGIAPPFSVSTIDEGESPASCPRRFTAGDTDPGTHWIGGWVGTRVGLDAVKRKIVRCPESNPDRRGHIPSLYRLFFSGVQ